MEVEDDHLDRDFPLQTVGFPLPCDVFVGVYLISILAHSTFKGMCGGLGPSPGVTRHRGSPA